MQTTGDGDAFDVDAKFDELLAVLGLDRAAVGGEVTFSGTDPMLPSVARLGAISALTKMAAAAATAAIWKMRCGEEQQLHADFRKTIFAMSPFFTRPLFRLAGRDLTGVQETFENVNISLYRTRDDRYFLPTGIYPGAFGRMLRLLGCSNDARAIANAFMRWDGLAIEQAFSERDLPGTMARTPEEWANEEQRGHVLAVPLIEIVKLADGDARPFAPAERPLSGVKVLGMTHVLAGPSCMQTLAEQGAETLNVWGPASFEHDQFYAAANTGARSTYLDLAVDSGKQSMRRLVEDADVFVENLRADVPRRLGVGPQAMAEMSRRGIVYVSCKCFGHGGPWASRPGFDMDAVCASGFTVREGTADMPALPPTYIFNDFTAGYLAAAGALAALVRRANEGGSYLVKLSLSRCMEYYESLGFLDKSARALVDTDEVHTVGEPDMVEGDTPLGSFRRIGAQIDWSRTKPFWPDPMLVPRGSGLPAWQSSRP